MARKRKPSAWESDPWYPPSRPRPVADGIAAKTTRGAFGASWWGKRWIAALEQFGWGSRLQRGRSYARKGQVISLDVAPGQVQARVQGSARTPYRVTLGLPVLTDAQWAGVLDALAQQAIFAAQLLAGELPQDIEQVFAQAGAPLFPQAASDLITRCSCPDLANPCKHIAAVYYLLGERFDDDPFLIFQLRGRTQAALLAALRERRTPSAPAADDSPIAPAEPALRDLLDAFYTAGPELADLTPRVAAPSLDAPILRRYGPPPGDSERDLRAIYAELTRQILDQVVGDDP